MKTQGTGKMSLLRKNVLTLKVKNSSWSSQTQKYKITHPTHTLSGVIWAGEQQFYVTVTELCSSLSGHAQGFPRPSSHARGAESWLLSDGRKTSNIFKTLRNLIESSKCERRSRGGWEREQRNTASSAEKKRNRREKEGGKEWMCGGEVKSGLTSTDKLREERATPACVCINTFKKLSVLVILFCEENCLHLLYNEQNE